jgi:hypothetical protein
MKNFRITYTYQDRIIRPSFRQEFERLAKAFNELDPKSEDSALADKLLRHLIDLDNGIQPLHPSFPQ